ncbi:MAG: tail-specific protease [Flavobacterium sp.]|nr:tail-specific protease [Flavobacterium sp.]
MRKLLISLFVILISAYGCKAQNSEIDKVLNKDHKIDTNKVLKPEPYHTKETYAITSILKTYHYRKINLNDSLSSAILDDYLRTLDPQKMFFLKSDVQQFEQYRFKFDDFMKTGDLNAAFEIFNVFKKRMTETMQFISANLKSDINLNENDKMKLNRKDDDYAKTAEERNDLWRKRNKNDVLTVLFTNKTKTRKECQEQILKRMQNFHKNILQYTPEDLYQLYISSVSSVLDPHTDYMSPATVDQFKIGMAAAVEGIGATLTNDGDYITITNVVPGGPAFKSKLVDDGDKIIGVAQGDSGKYVDIINWTTNDAVKLIRGTPGSVVKLQIIKAKAGVNDLPAEIRLVRDKVKLEEQKAKKEILEFSHDGKNFKIGIIDLPTFYNETAKDFRRIIDELKKEKIDGIVVDLRGNGGGSLPQVVETVGLFINTGPVVQVKDYRSVIDINEDPVPGVLWDGPLAVMTDWRSASASEIFAAAIQDYGRGVIIGDKSYGKGTVQTLLELNRDTRLNDISERLGQLKLTFAKFYRINGSSTQRKGVTPDIQFPSINPQKEHGEEAQPSALPWDQISSSKFAKYDDLSKYIPKLKEKYENRMKQSSDFKYLLEDISEYYKQRGQKDISLNEKVRRKELEDYEAKKKEREQLKLITKKEVDMPEKGTKDFQLKEGANILADLILMKGKS